MTARWLAMQEAADRLSISTRTLRRRVNAGELEARDGAGGRREVLVDTSATMADTVTDALSTVQGAAGAAVTAFQARADDLRDMLSGARRSARAGWGTLALVFVLASAGCVYAVQRITQADTRADMTADMLSTAAAEVVQARARADKAAAELLAAREDLAGAVVQLEAAQDAEADALTALDALTVGQAPALQIHRQPDGRGASARETTTKTATLDRE
ncbi:MAG TPA: hypothetical protein VMW52_09695 [Phycisphaerae bacterium]|nr:hypothetical protein [Phycisphaerae bacterium]